VNYLLNAFHAKSIACLQGLQMAVDLGVGHIIVEINA
jgi:hypothetical protein